MNIYHLAQINIARAKAPLDSPVMKGFVDRLDEINSLAESSSGFIWRLQTDEGDATAIQAFDDPKVIVNMSVWESINQLKAFVYKSIHTELLQQKNEWFDKSRTPHQVLWWIPAGHIPTVEEGKTKLELLVKNGSTEQAFTFAKPHQWQPMIPEKESCIS